MKPATPATPSMPFARDAKRNTDAGASTKIDPTSATIRRPVPDGHGRALRYGPPEAQEPTRTSS